MEKVRILITDPISPKAVEELRKIDRFEVEEDFSLTPEELKAKVGGFHVLIVRSATKVRSEIIDAAKNLKLIIRGGVGLDNIDVEYAKSKGIEVMNTPRASSNGVAELVLGMLFCLLRKIPYADRSMKEGRWEKKNLKGREAMGKVLGIIGYGNIGRLVGEKAVALGMKVLAYDIFMSEILKNYTPPEGVKIAESMSEVLENSDVITVHVPFIKEKGALIRESELNKMKEGAILINCARGGVVDEKAVYEALRSGKLSGYGVDVYEKEPPEYRDFIEMDNVVATPHIGASTKESQDRIGEEIVRILKEKFLS